MFIDPVFTSCYMYMYMPLAYVVVASSSQTNRKSLPRFIEAIGKISYLLFAYTYTICSLY